MTISNNPFLIRQKTLTQIENPSLEQWVFHVAENGLLQADFLQTNASLSIRVYLEGNSAKCELNCCYLVNNNNMINIDIQVIHEAGNTTSSQQIRGLVTDQADINFTGTITIPYDSQKCDGHQNHRGIVLSDNASISATPQLEIWADDVKCAHGSAIGPLDKEQLFYLQTRGISESEAKKLLLSSFFSDLMPTEFNPLIEDWIAHHV